MPQREFATVASTVQSGEMLEIASITILFFICSPAAADGGKKPNVYSSIFGLEVVAAANDQEVMEHVSNGTAVVLSPGGEGAWNLLFRNFNRSEVVESSFPIRYEEMRVATAARSTRRPPSSYHAIASVFSATVWSLYLLCLLLASILIFSYTLAARGRRKDGLSIGDRAWKAARFAGAPALGQRAGEGRNNGDLLLPSAASPFTLAWILCTALLHLTVERALRGRLMAGRVFAQEDRVVESLEELGERGKRLYFPTTDMALAESLANSPLRHERKLGQKAIKKEWFLEEPSVQEIAKLLGKGRGFPYSKEKLVQNFDSWLEEGEGELLVHLSRIAFASTPVRIYFPIGILTVDDKERMCWKAMALQESGLSVKISTGGLPWPHLLRVEEALSRRRAPSPKNREMSGIRVGSFEPWFYVLAAGLVLGAISLAAEKLGPPPPRRLDYTPDGGGGGDEEEEEDSVRRHYQSMSVLMREVEGQQQQGGGGGETNLEQSEETNQNSETRQDDGHEQD